MGRKKVQMKRIENKSRCQVTFSKRRTGLIKKAREISILCDVEVALVIFSSRGKLYEYCSSESLASILERYWNHFEEKTPGSTSVSGKESHLHSHAELLQMVERQLEEPNVQQLTVTDLVQLEKKLDASLIQTKARKTELMLDSISTLQEKEKALRVENQLLEKEIAEAQKKKDDEDATPPVVTTLNLLR